MDEDRDKKAKEELYKVRKLLKKLSFNKPFGYKVS